MLSEFAFFMIFLSPFKQIVSKPEKESFSIWNLIRFYIGIQIVSSPENGFVKRAFYLLKSAVFDYLKVRFCVQFAGNVNKLKFIFIFKMRKDVVFLTVKSIILNCTKIFIP